MGHNEQGIEWAIVFAMQNLNPSPIALGRLLRITGQCAQQNKYQQAQNNAPLPHAAIIDFAIPNVR
jgi:hypothetical protein